MFGKDEMREYMRVRRAAWASAGLCPYCGKKTDNRRWKICSKCREKARARQRKYEDRRRENGGLRLGREDRKDS